MPSFTGIRQLARGQAGSGAGRQAHFVRTEFCDKICLAAKVGSYGGNSDLRNSEQVLCACV